MIERFESLSTFGQSTQKFQGSLRRAALLFVLLLVASLPAFGQLTTADILGTVTDASGAVVPNAQVTVTNQGTQEKRTTTSNASGDYLFSLLPPGHYSVQVTEKGFK